MFQLFQLSLGYSVFIERGSGSRLHLAQLAGQPVPLCYDRFPVGVEVTHSTSQGAASVHALNLDKKRIY